MGLAQAPLLFSAVRTAGAFVQGRKQQQDIAVQQSEAARQAEERNKQIMAARDARIARLRAQLGAAGVAGAGGSNDALFAAIQQDFQADLDDNDSRLMAMMQLLRNRQARLAQNQTINLLQGIDRSTDIFSFRNGRRDG